MIGRSLASRGKALWFAACMLLGGLSAIASEGTRVTLLPPEGGEYWAGERIDFSIELIAQGQFSGASRFDFPRLESAILLQVSRRPVLDSRVILGETYVVQRHSFALYAQRGGRLTVPGIGVRFGSKSRYDRPVVEHALSTDELVLDISAPSGAEPGRPIVAASHLLAEENWKPVPAAASVGDALTRSIRLTADGVPSMLLPAIRFAAPEGVAVYPEEPELRDEMDRGAFRGERVERVTYVLERAGEFELPAIRIRWWDTDVDAWQSREFPAVKIEVAVRSASDDLSDADEAGASAERSPVEWTILAVLGVALFALASRMLQPTLRAWRAARDAAEPAEFGRLLETCKTGNPAETYRAISCWLGRLGATTVQLGPEDAPARSLRRNLEILQRQLVRGESGESSSELREALTAFRNARLATRQEQRAATLPALNPPGSC